MIQKRSEQKRIDSKKRTKVNRPQEASKSEQKRTDSKKANNPRSEQNSQKRTNWEFVRFYSRVGHLVVNAYTKGVSLLEISRRLIVLAVARSEAQNLATAGWKLNRNPGFSGWASEADSITSTQKVSQPRHRREVPILISTNKMLVGYPWASGWSVRPRSVTDRMYSYFVA